MRILINIMIFLGSALMVYNIVRYGNFVKRSGELEYQSRGKGLLIVPLLLLVFFLIGYLVVGFSGIADMMVAAILFGGSIFVFLLLTVMYSIIRRMQDTNHVLSLRYEEMKEDLRAMAKDSLAVFLVNLTKDEVEERAGEYLYDTDLANDSYSDLMKARGAYVLDPGYSGAGLRRFRREALLTLYEEGQTSVSEVLLVRRRDGMATYVRLEATLTRMPVSGDIVAFITERTNNEHVVRRRLLENVLMEQYDRIAYLIDGKYRVLISNDGKKSGLLLPADEEEDYETLYFNYILPAQPKDRDKSAPNPLRLSVIAKALERNDFYDVNAPFVIDGRTHYKHFVFYCIDRRAKFYLMLLSDSTQLQEEQMQQNRRLSAALEEAVRSNQARIRFFTNVSHNLRTPMNGIIGYATLARSESDPQKVREYLEKVDASGRKLLSLVDDLFAMSQIDSGTLQFTPEPTDLRSLVEELGGQFAALRPENALTLRTEAAQLKAPVVLCDVQRLRQLLSRLLENACAYAPKGESILLSVAQEPSDDPACGDYVFSISNCGVEIPQDVLNRIFEPDAWEMSEKSGGELIGVGIGMAVAKAFVDAMGGTVAVRSGADGQTRIEIRLSFPPAEQEKAPAAAEPTTDDLRLHILLVDDNAINREIAELMLTAEGWTVEQAVDGSEAVKKVAEAEPGAFDLVLMDVQMPVMNGYEATAAIRALTDPRRASVPIIAVTANAYQEDANEALAAGMDGYTTKPIDPAAIRAEVAKVLDKKAQTASAKEGSAQ